MKKIKINKIFIFAVSILIPLPIILTSIFNGSMPFWFDPARDFLDAIANQSKLTLIGQPTGIPGLFYGPYWVWLLSVMLFISKDPRIVQFLTLGVAYTIIFPLVLFKFKTILDKKTVILLWFLFIFSFMRYAIYPWNPHLAPLFALTAIYLLVNISAKRYWLYSLAAGFVTGMMGNFHISFSVGFVIGVGLYFIFYFLQKMSFENFKRTLISFILFATGFTAAFMPFLLFEVRHGFNQTKTVLNTLLSPYAQVGLKGLSKKEILDTLLLIPDQIFQLSGHIGLIILLLLLILFIVLLITKKIKIDKSEKNLIALCVLVILSVFAVFYKSKNPVWEYHFIAMEIPILLLIGIMFKKLLLSKPIIIILTLVIISSAYYNFIFIKRPSLLAYDTLGKKEYIVNLINSDANGGKYTVFVYNPGIYTYDYSYLFKYQVGKDVPYDPSLIKKDDKIVYLVIQKTTQPIFDDFVNFHTDNKRYKTIRSWKIEDGTQILKREQK